MNEPIDLAALLEAAYDRGVTREDLVRASKIARGTIIRAENGQEIRRSSRVKLLEALSPTAAAPGRRVPRSASDLSDIDDDALLAEVRRRMQDHRPVDRW